MPDNEEEVLYSFTGDVSSLKQATTDALKMLDKYQDKINALTAVDSFGTNARAAKSFQSNLNAVTKQITKMQDQLRKVSDVKLPQGSDVSKQIAGNLGGMQNIWGQPGGADKLSTKDVQSLTSQLKGVKQGFIDSASGVDTLIQKELQWQGTLDTIRTKTEQFKNTLTSIPKAINSVFAPLMSRLNSLQNPFSQIVAKMQTFKSKAAEAFSRTSQVANTVLAAFRRVSTATDSVGNSADSASKKHKSLGVQIQSLFSKFKQETQAITDEENSLKKKNKTLNDSTRGHRSLLQILLNLGNSFRRETTNIANFSTHISGLTGRTRALSSALSALPLALIGKLLSKAANQSIEYAENLNLFSVATGDAFEESLKFIEQMQELYGMDPSNLMRYAGNFYQLADAISMPDQAAANLSLGLTKATNDIASLFNVDIETVFNDLTSGMQGMSRAVRKYGMDIRATTLEQTALSLGIEGHVENMSEANRQALRFITMMRQASNASGDFARTIEQPANQLRIFKEQMSQLGRAIGDLFIGPLTVAIQYINGFVMALRMIISFIGSILGIAKTFTSVGDSVADTSDNMSSAIGGVGGAAKDTAEEIKKLLAPFDELTVLEAPKVDTSGAGGGGGLGDLGNLDPKLAEAIAQMAWKLDEVKMKANQVRDAILSFLGFKVEDGTILSWDAGILEQNLINKFPQWTKTIQATFDNWSGIVEGFKAVFISLGEVAQAVWQKVTDFWNTFVNDDTVSSFISNLATNLQNLATWISTNADGIANFVIALGAFRALTSLLPAITTLFNVCNSLWPVISAIGTALAGLSAPALAIAAIIAVVAIALADLLIHNEEFRNKFVEAWNNIKEVVSNIWNEWIEPILKRVGESIVKLYEEQLKPIVEKICNIILDLWNDVLKPVIDWIVSSLAPQIRDVADKIMDIVDWVFNNVGSVIKGILDIIQGIIDFVVGVFTGDWDRAWTGVVEIFKGIFESLGGIIGGVLNLVISVINAAITVVWDGVVGLLNLALGVVNQVGSLFGQSWSLNISAGAPTIPYVTIPALASGGVVTGPTQAMIGEGRYDEMVMPLGNSPQANDFADMVADRANTQEQIELLREQNDLLRQILAKTGKGITLRELTSQVSNEQRSMSRARGVMV